MATVNDIEAAPLVSTFKWNESRSYVAIELAHGRTQKEIAEECGIGERTIRNWVQHPEFSAEVDRLTLMVGIANRAERLRIAMRVARQSVKEDGTISTRRDILDWLKYAQSETDAIKLELEKIAATFGADAAPVAT
jgi:predicted transcriptional regulator